MFLVRLKNYSTKQKILQEGKSCNAVTIDESYSENNNESFSGDPRSLKKQQKEERKLQKQLTKKALRMAKKAKHRAKEEANSN